MKHWLKSMIATLSAVALLIVSLPAFSVMAEDGMDTAVTTDIPETSSSTDPYIVSEEEGKREADVKHFRLSDGRYLAAQYDTPVHYLDENDEWQEYDNRLLDSDADTVSNQSSDVSVKLSKKAKEKKLIRVRTQGYELAWGYADVFKTDVRILQTETELEGNRAWTNLTNTSSSVIYENVYKDTDLEIHLSGGAVKENLILKNAAAARSYTLNYEIGDLTVQQQDTQTILLKSAEGEVIYTVSAPYMVDSKGAYSNGIAMSASVDGKKMTVTLTPDMAWLQDAARVYPVTIDPFTNTAKTVSDIESASLLSIDTTSYPYGWLLAGKSAAYGRMLSVFKPKLPLLEAGDIVVHASLQLYQIDSYGTTQVNVSRITQPWTETDFIPSVASGTLITEKYNNRPDKADKIDDFVLVDSTTAGQHSLDITRTVQGWYRDPETPNYGVMLWSQNPDTATYACFRRESNVGAQYAYQFPTVQITYLNADGLESYWHYHSMAATQRGTAYVNTYTGAAVVTETVFSTNGNRMPLSVSLTYNSSLYNKEFEYGASVSQGFMFNFQQRIEPVTDSELIAKGYKYIYTDGDGTKHYFRQTDNDESTREWTDETGQGMILKSANTSETGLYIEFKDGSKLHFFGATMGGVLRWAEDTYGNRVVYTSTREYEDTYGRLITRITDGAGRSVNISYVKDGELARPATMTDNEGRTYTFVYEDGRLVKITYPDNTYTSYTYTNGLLHEIRDSVSKRRTTYEYDIRTRTTETGETIIVDIWTEYLRSQIENGSTVLDVEEYNFINFNNGSVYVMDYDLLGICYYFDKYGRVIGAMDDENATYHADYAVSTGTQSTTTARTDTQKENKLINEGSSFAYVNNYVVNSSAERDGGYGTNCWDSSGINGTSIDNTVSYLGNRSLKIKHDQSGMRFSGHRQQIPTTLAGEAVTFSAYVKAQNVSATAEATAGKWGAGLMFEFYDADNAWISTNYIPYFQTGTTDDWVRMSMTYTIPESAARAYVFVILRNATGTAWFDCLQLERGAALNDYNLLENSNFSNSTVWEGSGNLETSNGIYGGQLTIIGGGAGSNKYAYQRMDINASGICFNVYGMMWGTQAARKDGRLCALELCVRYTDNTVKYFTKNFHDSDDIQQAISFTVKTDASKTVATVGYFFIFRNNVNTAHLLATMLTIDKNGENYTYDDNGNLKTAQDNAFRADGFTFDDATNQLQEYTNTENEEYEYVYDADNPYQLNVVYSKQRNNGYSYSYDSYGNVTSVTMGKITGNAIDNTLDTITASVTYADDGNYVDTVTDSLGNETRYTIDPQSGLTQSVNYVAGGTSRAQTNYTYNATTRLLSGISSTATDNTVEYMYDAKRRLRKISVGGNDYRLNCDAYNNPTTTQWGTGTLTTNTYADPRKGLVSMVRYGNGAKINYAYDEYDRLISKSLDGSSPLNITYNKRGQISKIKEGARGYTTDYTYDLIGRLTQSDTYGSRRTRMRYTYDNMDRMTYVVWEAEGSAIDASYTYGDDGWLESMNQGSLEFTYHYDHLGRLASEDIQLYGNPNVLKNVYEYVEDTTQVATKELTINGGLIDIQRYHYYPGGELSSVDDTQYTYDTQGQLVEEYSMATGQVIEYTYVGNGNLSTVNTYQLEKTGDVTLLSSNTYAYSNSDRSDLLESYNGQSITYDMIGNPLTYRDGMSMTWVHGRQLSAVSKNGGTLGAYTYDSNGLRVAKSVNGQTTNFYYDDAGRLIRSGDGTNAIWYFYGPNDTAPQSIKYNGTRYYYIKNVQGDVVGIVDGNGTVVARYTYDSWGNVLSVTKAGGADITDTTHLAHRNPIRYRGYYYDEETGFYYLRSRYYDPAIGRFLNADGYVSTGQGILGYNMFAYCGNNPVNRADPTGMFWKEIGDFFSNAWNGIKTWAKNTFGAGSSTTATIAEIETPVIPDPSPITVKTGTKTTQTISKHGDSSKPISVYANKDAQHPIKSLSAGININIVNFTLDLSVGLDDIGLSGSLTNGNTTNSFGIKLNLSELKIGFEGSTAIQWDNTTETAYTNASISGWAIAAAYILVTTGQYVQSPSYAY